MRLWRGAPLLTLLAIVIVAAAACEGDGAIATPAPAAPTTAPENNAPIADFSWHPDAVPEGDDYRTKFTFNAVASDPEGDPLSYEWQFTAGQPSAAAGESVVTSFPGAAEYRVTLIVSDGKGGETLVVHTVPLTAGPQMPASGSAPPTPTPDTSARYKWEFFDVEKGAKPAIAINGKGEVAIAIAVEEPHGLIKYAAWGKADPGSPEGFEVSTVAGGYFYAPLDLVFGPDDRPYLTWHDHQDPDMFVPELGDLTYATLVDGEWKVEAVFSTGHDGWDNSAAVDARGNIHVSAIDPTNFLREEGVEYYLFDGQKWTVEKIGTPPLPYEWGTSLALDREGRPHVTYHNPESADLFYAFKGPDGWVHLVVDSEGDVGKYASLALDKNGLPVISYLELKGPLRGASNGNIKMARAVSLSENGAQWEIQQIGTLDDIFMGFRGARLITSLVLDPNDNPIVAYSDQSKMFISYFDGGAWHTELVATRSDLPFEQLVSLALGPDGTLHLAYTEVERREFPGVLGNVKYARGTPRD